MPPKHSSKQSTGEHLAAVIPSPIVWPLIFTWLPAKPGFYCSTISRRILHYNPCHSEETSTETLLHRRYLSEDKYFLAEQSCYRAEDEMLRSQKEKKSWYGPTTHLFLRAQVLRQQAELGLNDLWVTREVERVSEVPKTTNSQIHSSFLGSKCIYIRNGSTNVHLEQKLL